MATPPVEGTPLVVYYGPDSDTVVDRWNRDERPFELRGIDVTEDVAISLDQYAFDCVVCYGDGPDADHINRVVGQVRDRTDSVPVVVFDGSGTFDVGAAMDLGVTQYFDVDAEFDPAEDLERLEPLVERTREQRRNQSMLDSLLGHIPLSVYCKDQAGRHVRVSDALTSMIGPEYLESPDGKRHHAPEDVVGKTDYDLYPDDLAEETVRDDEQIVESGESIDERIERSAGGELDGTYVATSKVPWYDDQGQIQGVIGVTRNITERQRYEKQLERQNERLRRFASVISHDLRNPLEVAFGRLEFAERTGDPEHFEAMENALDRMNALIDDVLALARQGETISDPERIDLADAASEAWSVIDAPDATLTVDSRSTVLADPGRLQQLLENVFRNAVEHGSTSPRSQAPEDAVEHGSTSPRSQARQDSAERSSAGSRTASDDAVEHGGDDVTVVVGDLATPPGFFVADDGPGIPESDREDVFDSGYSTGEAGTGLGLSIVRTIAEAHGWDVAVTDSEFPETDGSEGGEADGHGPGARFEFTEVQEISR